MTSKKYQTIRIAIIIALSAITSQAIVTKNYILPIIAIVIASLALFYTRRQVKSVLADERDQATAGQASFIAMQVYSWIAVVIMLVLYALRDQNPTYEPVAQTLAYSTCTLMLSYSLVFRYYNRFKFSAKKIPFLFIALILALVGTIFTIRLFSGEDNWVCQKGEWVKHGQPSFSAPTTPCK